MRGFICSTRKSKYTGQYSELKIDSKNNFRNQIKSLQTEVEQLKKVLSREVGEAHVEDALNVKKVDNAWRGRAEMIENQKYHHQLQHNIF